MTFFSFRLHNTFFYTITDFWKRKILLQIPSKGAFYSCRGRENHKSVVFFTSSSPAQWDPARDKS